MQAADRWITTYTGKQFYPLDPRPADVDIEDIAHHLANKCRYSGATRWFCSVAQHSVIVADNLPPELRLHGLLHDAAEAYLPDLASPIKDQFYVGEGEGEDFRLVPFVEVEDRVLRAIYDGLGIAGPPWADHPLVKTADDRAAATERRDSFLAPFPLCPRTTGVEPFEAWVAPWIPEVAERIFLRRFEQWNR